MSENRTDWVKDAGWLSELIKAARNDEAEFDTLLRRLLVAHAESLAQPAPVAPAGEVRLSEEERDTLWTTAAEHAWRGVTSPPEALTEPLCEGLAPFCCGNPSCPAHGSSTEGEPHV